MGGASGGGASWKWKDEARKIFLPTCGSLCHRQQLNQTHVLDHTASCDLKKKQNTPCRKISSETVSHHQSSSSNTSSSSSSSNKNLCTICLEPLNSPIFTAQCSHSFHFSCIASNVRHGSVTCPICRAHWTQLPRNLNPLSDSKIDPVLQILDDSIANSRFHRRSFLRSARYDDYDPVDQSISCFGPPRLSFSRRKIYQHQQDSDSDSGSGNYNNHCSSATAYLNVKLLSHRPPIDLVLVASPNGPHLRLMKQAMALAVFSLKPTDRLAIVTYSSSASRVFPLRRMTSHGKRTALQVIDRLFYSGHAYSMEGLMKGVKIIEDRLHKNPKSSILHLTDNPPSRSHAEGVPVSIRRFNVSYGFGASSGFVMHEFEEFLARTIGGVVRNVQVRVVGEDDGARALGIGELRGDEERNIPLYAGGPGPIRVGYSYVEDGGDEECVRTGEVVVGFEETGDEVDSVSSTTTTGAHAGMMRSIAETPWEYHDTFMARRWAKRLNGYGI